MILINEIIIPIQDRFDQPASIEEYSFWVLNDGEDLNK